MRSLITSSLMLLALGASAQEKQYSFGIEAGYVSSRLALENTPATEGFKSSGRNSFYAGISVSRHFSEKFSLQSGLFLVNKGGNFSYASDPGEETQQELFEEKTLRSTGSIPVINAYAGGRLASVRTGSGDRLAAFPSETPESLVSAKIEATLHYLEIPLNAIYTLSTGSGQVQIGAGPYYAVGVSGRLKSEFTIRAEGDHTSSSDEKVKFGRSDDADFSRHDFGLNFLAGFRFNNGISLNGGYGLGLADISAGADEGSIKSRLFRVGLGYSFK